MTALAEAFRGPVSLKAKGSLPANDDSVKRGYSAGSFILGWTKVTGTGAGLAGAS
jgi:hypothetical protein